MGRRLGLLGVALCVALGLASCAPANERPIRGAVPGSDGPTPAGVPPTLTPSDALRARADAAQSPGVVSSASPSPSASPVTASPVTASPIASPSVVAAPPIVRTIAPGANAHVPAGAPVMLSAVLVGRGADLASASLAVNGTDASAEIDKRSPREWSIHTSQTLGNGPHTARVLVRDASGAAGGFTWQFSVGDPSNDAPPADETPASKPAGSPQAKPPSP